MREFFYGLFFGAVTVWSYHHFDAPGILDYLNQSTAAAARSTSGYGGKAHQTPSR